MQIQKTPRNANDTESSVLFSLASLSAAAPVVQPVAKAAPAKAEDLFGIGAPTSPVIAPVVAAPVSAPSTPAPRSARTLILAASILAIGILGGSYAAAMALRPAPIAPIAPIAPTPIATIAPTPVVDAPAPAREPESPVVEATPTPVVDAPTSHPRVRRPDHVDPVVVAHPDPTPDHPLSLVELAERAARPQTPVATPPAHREPVAAATTPSRTDVVAAMHAVTPAVSACSAQGHGLAAVRITVASTGRVSSALVTGPLAGTPAGTCVAQAVRGATFPAFTQSTFVVNYPFQL